MRRRTVLRAGGVAATAWLAGCGASGVENDDDGGGTTETTSATTSEPETTAQSTVTGRELSIGKRDCGTGQESASVAFDADGGRVRVSGTIGASDPCHAPEIESLGYDSGTRTLAITVEAVDDSEEGAMCAGCLADLAYELTVAFDGGLPDRVTVDHRGLHERRVTDASRR